MAGEVRIGGNTASVKLQGNDSITSDQTFTFPDAGGELATVPAGGQVPGYAEGTYTATFLKPADLTPQTGFIYSNQSGWYTRIGRMVFVQVYLGWTAKSLSDTSTVMISLPFPALNSTNYRSGISIGYNNGLGSGQQMRNGGFSPNVAGVSLYYIEGSGRSRGVEYDAIDADGQIQFSAQYITDEAFS